MPNIEMQRSTFDLSHSSITTFNVGDLIPLTKPIEVYPGDTFEITTTKIVRLQTLLSPFFGALYLDVYWFYVPNRIVHDNWPGVMGENMTGPWAPSVSYTTPLIQSGSSGFDVGSIEDHYGLPVGVGPVKVNALPIRGYGSIWDNYFRSQDLQYPLNIYKGDATKYTTASDPLAETNMTPRKACRMHDYFSSCQPAPLKALNPVLIPMSGAIPVVTKTDAHDQDTPIATQYKFTSSTVVPRYLHMDANDFNADWQTTPSNTHASYPTNLWAEVIPGLGTQQGVVATINDLRTAFQIQRMLERDAMSGSRYRETILAHFSVSTGDARMQIPEYLGGNRCTLNIQQVVNNSESSSYKLGNIGAMSHTVDSHADFIKSFVEHGFLHCLGVVRFSNDYAQGMDRLWFRSDRYSYYWPSLAFIGAQAVKNKEIFTQGNSVVDSQGDIVDDQVFGYQEAWAELRQIPNQVSALMRPQVTGTLASWNLADDYGSTLPTLSDGWIKSDETTVDRVLAVKSTTSDQLFGNFYFDIKATRVLPMFSVPGLVDHF